MSHVDDGVLHSYLDGACSEGEREQVEKHLTGCADCRERLERAQALSRRASDLLGELEPGPLTAPAWRELEERSAAGRRTSDRRWLRPSLAWAASIAFAFVIGWFSSSYLTGVPDLAEVAARLPQTRTQVDRADRLESDQAKSQPALQSPTEESSDMPVDARLADAEGRGVATARNEAEPVAQQREPVAAGAIEVFEVAEPEADRDDRAAGEAERERTAEPDVSRPAADELENANAAAPSSQAERRSREGARSEEFEEQPIATDEVARAMQSQLATTRTANLADDASSGGFIAVQPQQAAVWLGDRLRTLPDLRLQRVEVGPGSMVRGGIVGLPAVRLVYQDAAGHEITLIQQRQVSAAGADALPSLVVEPSGLRAYRWEDGAGYLFILVGSVSSDSLRALAMRVR